MLKSQIKALLKKFGLFSPVARAATLHLTLPEKPMVIVIASHNNQKWVYKNLMSVFTQDYSNYRIIYIDDASTDGTVDEVEHLVREKAMTSRVTFIRNTTRKGALCNHYNAIWSCRDDEIILNLDGDDWFANSWALKAVNTTYSTQDVWLTHGTLVEYPGYVLRWSIPIPEQFIKNNAFRAFRCPSHLKTFYAWLFKKIHLEDLQYQEEFFPMTGDQAMMFPMLEMAGKRHAFITEALYVYNRTNPINDDKVDGQFQRHLERLIREKPPYNPLAEAFR